MTDPSTPVPIPRGVADRLVALLDKASKFTGITHECRELQRFLREEMALEEAFGTDHERLLLELTEAVAMASGRHFAPTADEHGLKHCKAALEEMTTALGATQDSTALHIIRAALSAPRLSYRLVLGSHIELGTFDTHVYPTPNSSLKGEDGTRYRVDHVTMDIDAPTATVWVSELAS